MDCLIFSILIICCTVASTYPYPWHASCSLKWEIPDLTCDIVSDKILEQIDAWNMQHGDDLCRRGTVGTNEVHEKCLYRLISRTTSQIKATHETPIKRYVDTLTFTLTPDGKGCNVDGFSTSNTWYAILDYGTNYCNLHNLADGSGLLQSSGFVETTSDNKCTQFSSSDCDRY